MIRLPIGVVSRHRCTQSLAVPKGGFLAGLCAAWLWLASCPGQDLAAPRAAALESLSRGRNAAAVIAFSDLAARAAADAPLSDAITAEACAAMALLLYSQHPSDAQLIDRVLQLRTSPLAARDPSFADQIGILALEQLRARGDDRVGQLARELGFIDNPWLCGPFDNERGAGYRREFAAETTLNLDAAHAGKQRPVRWRRLRAKSPHGSLLLGAVLRPDRQVACLTATAVIAETDCTAALHIGSSGGFVVRLNGSRIAARDVERRFAFDQDAVALPLVTGANLLLVKLCHQEHDEFEASLRLSKLDGGPLTSVVVSGDPTDLAAATRAVASTRATRPPKQGARSRGTTDDTGGYDAMWLSLLWHLRGADAEGERRDRAFAERAVSDLPEVAQARMLLAASRTRLARMTAEVDENERRRDYEMILLQDPGHVGAAVQLGRLLLDNMSLRQKAEQLARQALTVNPDHNEARFLLARTLQAAGLDELALRAGLTAATGPAHNHVLAAVAAQLTRHQRWRQAERLFARLGASSGDPSDQLAVAEFHLHRGEQQAAMACIERAVELEPLAKAPIQLRASLYEAAGDYQAALQEYARWLGLCPDDDDAMARQSQLYGRMGRRDEQIESLRAAVTCNPNRRHDQRYLEFLAAETAPFYAPWQLDERGLLTVETAQAAIEAKDPVFHLLRQSVVHAHHNGTRSQYVHMCIRILTEAGARSLASFGLTHHRREQRARLLSCTVHRATGAIERPRLRGARVTLDALQPGDTVDIEGRIDDLAPSFFGDYFGLQHFLPPPDGSAAHRSDLVVIADPGREYRYQLTGGAPEPSQQQLEDGTRVFAFSATDLPRDVLEPFRPGRKERLPLVRFSTFRDWDTFAAWYWNLIRGQIETTVAMRQKVRELTADCDTDEQRIAALYRFVTTDVRYEAWEFGVHGYKPYSTSVIFDRRHGDCKDKALLLCALLDEIDVRARPVLIFANPRRTHDDLTLPMVEHFNHCIAWMPEQDGRNARFLDCTATWHPPELLPEMDQGAGVLVVDGDRARLETVPHVTPDQNGQWLSFEVQLRDDGGASVRQMQEPRGNAAVSLRAALATEPSRRLEGIERSLVPLFGPIAISALQASDPMDLGAPVKLTVDLTVDALGQRNGRKWQLPSTFGNDPLLSLTSEPERRTPLLLSVPHRDQRVVRYRLPAGYRLESLPEDLAREAPFGQFAMTWRANGDEITVERSVTLSSPRIEVPDYPAFRDFAGELRAADARVLVVARQGRSR